MSDVKNAPAGSRVEPVRDQNGAAWDETRSPGTSGGWHGIAGADRLLYGMIAMVSVGIGVVNALSWAHEAARRGRAYDFVTPLFWEMSSIVVIIAAAPVLFVGVRRMRQAPRWFVRLGLAVAATTVFSTLHIAGMVGLRKLAMWFVGSSYDFNLSFATVLYEFRKDVITSVLIGGAVWLIHARDEAQQSRSSTATLPPDQPPVAPHMVWLRDGSTRIRIEPRDVIWISSAGNYTEYRMANGANHLVRGTLAAAETQLARFNLARIHRTRLANLNRVTGVEMKPSGDFELTFDTGQTVQGSRRYKMSVESLDRGQAVTLRPTAMGNSEDS